MSEKSYFERIEFRPQWREGLLFRYLTNMRVVLLLVMLIAVVGIASYLALPRRLNPDIKIPIVNITTLLPGAGPESVEQLLTVPLEDSVRGLSGVSKVSSSSRENLSVITIEFESSVDGQRARQDVQAAVSTVTCLMMRNHHGWYCLILKISRYGNLR
jgi:multidrug efflux pump subunit AcrB